MPQRHQLVKRQPVAVACMSRMGPSTTPNPPGLTPILNWSNLTQADQVMIYEDGSPIASGRVDMVASDAACCGFKQTAPTCAVSTCAATSRCTNVPPRNVPHPHRKCSFVKNEGRLFPTERNLENDHA
ncbi:hypothetical protein QFZ33_002304 [Arthrobacter globiformis]|nr:hypothetical protein [Arthrobacter globiformis]